MNYIVFDLEATCWDNNAGKRMEIIEIGAVKVNEKLEIIDAFQSFVKPKETKELSGFCKLLTSITQEDVDNADTFPVVLKRFQEWIGEDYCLCSWGLYDKKQLTSDCELHDLPTNWLANHISLKHQFAKSRRIKRVGMPAALKMLDLTLDGRHHRGIDDAKNIAKIFINDFATWKFGGN